MYHSTKSNSYLKMDRAVVIFVLIPIGTLLSVVWLWPNNSQNEVAEWLSSNGLGDLVDQPKIKSELYMSHKNWSV